MCEFEVDKDPDIAVYKTRQCLLTSVLDPILEGNARLAVQGTSVSRRLCQDTSESHVWVSRSWPMFNEPLELMEYHG
jgi:hypothetical protein